MVSATAWRIVALCLLCATAVRRGLGMHIVNAIYGETIDIPCGLDLPQNLLFGKWKYEMADGTGRYIATRTVAKPNVHYDDVPEYKDRLIMTENYTLSIMNAGITDEKKFVCMLVVEDNVFEAPTVVKVFKQPVKPEIVSQANFIETGKLNMLGECIAKDSYPEESNLTWYKNGELLKEVNETVIIDLQRERDQTNGLYTMKSSLQYMPTKDDLNAAFTCRVEYKMPEQKKSSVSEPAVFDVYYPTEKVTIQILSPTKSIKEGDNITLKCIGNGNPPPQDFLFYTPGQQEGISSSSIYTLTDVKRNATGDYKCSLPDQNMLASTTITVHYLDLSLTPSGEVTKQLGETLPVSCIASSSRNVSVVWMKDKNKLSFRPSFTRLQYQDAGNYVCESVLTEAEGLKKTETLTLIVEGKPRLKMSKKSNLDGKKVITCTVEGYPMPVVQWTSMGGGSIANTTEESPYVNGKYESKILIAPEENVTLICIAENKLDRSIASVNVSAISIPEQDETEDKNDENKEKVNDQAKLIVGIVVGLLLAALVAGIAYWLYMKKSKSASKHVGKELGNTEENKKLEENNHKSEA